MSKERQIRKISLNVSGLKGLILEGTYETYKENKLVINGFKDTIRNPIHLELEDKIKELRFFALEVCGLITDSTNKHEKQTLLEQADIVSLEFEKGIDGFFKLKCTSRVFDDKTQNLTTPKVDIMDNYEYYDTVMNIIEAILVEVDQYAKGLKKVTDEEIMLTYVRLKKDKDMDLEKVMLLDSDARAAYIETVSKKLGFIANVMEVDEIDEEELDEELVEETETGNNDLFKKPIFDSENKDRKSHKLVGVDDLFDASNMNLGEKEELDAVFEATKPEEGEVESNELRIVEPLKLKK